MLIVRIIGDKFNFIVDTNLIMDITTGLCSIFVILGILSVPKTKNQQETTTQETTETTEKLQDIMTNITNGREIINKMENLILDNKNAFNQSQTTNTENQNTLSFNATQTDETIPQEFLLNSDIMINESNNISNENQKDINLENNNTSINEDDNEEQKEEQSLSFHSICLALKELNFNLKTISNEIDKFINKNV